LATASEILGEAARGVLAAAGAPGAVGVEEEDGADPEAEGVDPEAEGAVPDDDGAGPVEVGGI
jgi:hypothetical protein